MPKQSDGAQTPADFADAFNTDEKASNNSFVQEVIKKINSKPKPSTTENKRKPYKRIHTVPTTANKNEVIEPVFKKPADLKVPKPIAA